MLAHERHRDALHADCYLSNVLMFEAVKGQVTCDDGWHWHRLERHQDIDDDALIDAAVLYQEINARFLAVYDF